MKAMLDGIASIPDKSEKNQYFSEMYHMANKV
jgi:hypothetical protein